SSISYNKGNGMYSSGIVSIIGDVMLTDGSVMKQNRCQGPGGAIACNFQGSIDISGKSRIEYNSCGSLGGAIVNFSLDLGMTSVTGESIISHNTVTDAQTIRQTIGAFLKVIFGQLDQMSLQTELSGAPGGVRFTKALPGIKA